MRTGSIVMPNPLTKDSSQVQHIKRNDVVQTFIKEKLAIPVARKCFTQLLKRSVSRRMFGHVKVNQTPGSDF